jgi:hypothetical protein
MTATGGTFRLGARSANGLSSSIKGEPRKGDVFPYPAVEPKSPRGGDVMFPLVVVASRGKKEF